ncbi:hypothetical protein, conserved [Eimeria praecox]|uniref:Reverse transcriptase/retrotransposon-derived protein RNase H-like domain-containing protein n=1 Tax=Eimeria praecox TaxID=51316 RepID=U6G9V6_9EIME|nr:hypothetical protein, conserved [Eimeria praecox]
MLALRRDGLVKIAISSDWFLLTPNEQQKSRKRSADDRANSDVADSPVHLRVRPEVPLSRIALPHAHSGFTLIGAPLKNLLKKDNPLTLAEREYEAARNLIRRLPSPPVFSLPDFDKPFFPTTDTSDTEAAVMVSQQAADSEKQQAFAWYSRRCYSKGAEISVT